MAKEVYFVVYYDEDDGAFAMDDVRAEALFDNDDIWDGEKWVPVSEDVELYREAKEALVGLLETTWNKGEQK